jgi:hypothetical protein
MSSRVGFKRRLSYGPYAPLPPTIFAFRLEGTIFQSTCLAFRLAMATWCFTKKIKKGWAFLRRQGIRLIVYLNDILIMNISKDTTKADADREVELLQSLVFLSIGRNKLSNHRK